MNGGGNGASGVQHNEDSGSKKRAWFSPAIATDNECDGDSYNNGAYGSADGAGNEDGRWCTQQ